MASHIIYNNNTIMDHRQCQHYGRDVLYENEVDLAQVWLDKHRPGGSYKSMQEAVDKACEQKSMTYFLKRSQWLAMLSRSSSSSSSSLVPTS